MAASVAQGSTDSVMLGRLGALYITDTNAHTGTFASIHAVSTTIIATLVGENLSGTWTAIPLNAGDTIYGVFTSITLTSGKVIAYNG